MKVAGVFAEERQGVAQARSWPRSQSVTGHESRAPPFRQGTGLETERTLRTQGRYVSLLAPYMYYTLCRSNGIGLERNRWRTDRNGDSWMPSFITVTISIFLHFYALLEKVPKTHPLLFLG